MSTMKHPFNPAGVVLLAALAAVGFCLVTHAAPPVEAPPDKLAVVIVVKDPTGAISSLSPVATAADVGECTTEGTQALIDHQDRLSQLLEKGNTVDIVCVDTSLKPALEIKPDAAKDEKSKGASIEQQAKPRQAT